MPNAPRIFKRLSELLDTVGQTGYIYLTGGTASFQTSIAAATVASSGTNSVGFVPMVAATGTTSQALLTNTGIYMTAPSGYRVLNLGVGFGPGAPFESSGRIVLHHDSSTNYTTIQSAARPT